MSVLRYSELGEALKTWGWDSKDNSTDAVIRQLDASNRLVCFAAAILEAATGIKKEVRRLASDNHIQSRTIRDLIAHLNLRLVQSKGESHAVANGMLAAIGQAKEYMPLESLDASLLSVRGRRVLQRAKQDGASVAGDLTKDFLLELRNCGVTTVSEIRKWAGLTVG